MILIDIGNSRIKWAELQNGNLGYMHALVSTEKNSLATLLNTWQQLSRPESIYLACVSSISIKLQVIQIARQLWPDITIHEIHTDKYAHGVLNAYPKYQKLGVDRWLSTLAGFHYYSAPVCIVACGTALTLDIVDEHGQHLGGMIMPGLNLLKLALSKGTENLSFCSARYPQGLADDTEAAIYNGSLCAIKGFIEQGMAEYKTPLQLVLTGGDAEFLADSLKLDATIDPKLVLKGLALIAIG